MTERPASRASRCPVARAGVEPATFRFSGGRSYQLSYLAAPERATISLPHLSSAPALGGSRAPQGPVGNEREGESCDSPSRTATPTGLEPATSAVTGRRANQLRHGALVLLCGRTACATLPEGPVHSKTGSPIRARPTVRG